MDAGIPQNLQNNIPQSRPFKVCIAIYRYIWGIEKKPSYEKSTCGLMTGANNHYKYSRAL